VVAPDLRGHGGTGGPDDPGEYSLEHFAEDVAALADQLGWGSFNLLGHSMGGMVAQHLVLHRPERVTGLVLMDTHHGPVRGIDPELLELAISVATSEGMEALATAMDALGASPLETEAARRLRDERPDLVALDRAKFLASHPAMYATMGRLLVDRPDRLVHLAEVAAPTLVMVGELDAPFLAASRRMAETIPQARLVVLEGAGHSPQRETPEAWWAALTQFLESIGSASSGE
jgi:pimeloyl-ACP methyl ester carboxylesterase